jgi:hypothetical protein
MALPNEERDARSEEVARNARLAARLAKKNVQRDPAYVLETWRFQRTLVKAVFLPGPIFGTYLLYYFVTGGNWPPPGWAAIGFGTSLGLGSFLAFLLWRCPACGEILFRGGGSPDPGFLWLEEPRNCHACGAILEKSSQSPGSGQKR